MFKKYAKRPLIVEAVQWTGKNSSEVMEFIKNDTVDEVTEGLPFRVVTLEGAYTASVGDWLIRGVKGELYPCKPDIFAASYDLQIDSK